jgi:hypothetical protein
MTDAKRPRLGPEQRESVEAGWTLPPMQVKRIVSPPPAPENAHIETLEEFEEIAPEPQAAVEPERAAAQPIPSSEPEPGPVAPPLPSDVPVPASLFANPVAAPVAPSPPVVAASEMPAPNRSTRRVPRLSDVLLERVRFGKAIMPLWGVAAVTIAAVAFGVGLFGLLLGIGLASAEDFADTASPKTRTSAVQGAQPSVGATNAHKRTGRSTANDAKLEQLAKKLPGTRTAPEAVALAEGAVERERLGAAGLRERLLEDPTLLKDPNVIKELQRYAKSEITGVDALAAMASLPGPISADLIYEVWTGTAERNSVTELAESLALSPEVSSKASPALKVALDLRRSEDCMNNLAVLPRALEHGDRRSHHLLMRRQRKYGCGATKKDDCFKCLRDGDQLKEAIKAVRTRPAPRL